MADPDSEPGFAVEERLPRVGDWVDGRYQLVRCIGEGGMGVVFEARHRFMDTSYALKFLREEFAVQEHLAERFLREARISGRIDNPHVVRVFDVNVEKGGLPYMVMELLVGDTLYDRQRGDEPLDALARDAVIRQVLDGVAAAHRIGVVHRDLKPSNIMLTKGDDGEIVAKVLDFGLAKLLEGGASGGLTEPGTVLGTADYMPPEQAFGQGVDQRADVFALGVIFFELIAGQRPVDGEAPAEIATAYQKGRIRRLEECVPGVDPELAEVIHRAIGPRPEDRYDSAVAFRAAYARFSPPDPTAWGGAPPSDDAGSAASQLSVAQPPAPLAEPTEPPSSTGLRVVLLVLAVGAALALIIWLASSI
jgi:serine/threonine-protein kinase